MNDITELHRGQFLRLLRDGRWEYVERVGARGAAFIVALTPDRELVLVEQYRVPLHARAIELPAGIIGDEHAHRDETVEASAMRELEEETGFRGSRAQLLFSGPTAPGMSAEMGHFVRIHDLVRVGPGGGTEDEDIRVHLVPLDALDAWLDRQRAAGLRIDSRVYVGAYFLR